MAEDDTLKLSAQEIENFLEIGDPIMDLETVFEAALAKFKSDGDKEFVVGKVIIENDLSDEEEESEDDDEESEDEKSDLDKTTEPPKE